MSVGCTNFCPVVYSGCQHLATMHKRPAALFPPPCSCNTPATAVDCQQHAHLVVQGPQDVVHIIKVQAHTQQECPQLPVDGEHALESLNWRAVPTLLRRPLKACVQQTHAASSSAKQQSALGACTHRQQSPLSLTAHRTDSRMRTSNAPVPPDHVCSLMRCGADSSIGCNASKASPSAQAAVLSLLPPRSHPQAASPLPRGHCPGQHIGASRLNTPGC
jgi:hypothetical protein